MTDIDSFIDNTLTELQCKAIQKKYERVAQSVPLTVKCTETASQQASLALAVQVLVLVFLFCLIVMCAMIMHRMATNQTTVLESSQKRKS